MRHLSLFLITLMLLSTLAGCLVRTNNRRHGHSHRTKSRADCPPAYHWNGVRCVHNGRGRGNPHRR